MVSKAEISPIPELKGLSGGRKQVVINSNLDLIYMINDRFGFDVCCRLFDASPDTIHRALSRANNYREPAINKAQVLMNRYYDLANNLDALFSRVSQDNTAKNAGIEVLLALCGFVREIAIPMAEAGLRLIKDGESK